MIEARFNTNTNKARHHAIMDLHHSLNQVAGGKIFKNVLKIPFFGGERPGCKDFLHKKHFTQVGYPHAFYPKNSYAHCTKGKHWPTPLFSLGLKRVKKFFMGCLNADRLICSLACDHLTCLCLSFSTWKCLRGYLSGPEFLLCLIFLIISFDDITDQLTSPPCPSYFIVCELGEL